MSYQQVQKIESLSSSPLQFGGSSVVDGYHMTVSSGASGVMNVFKRDIDGVWVFLGEGIGDATSMHGNYIASAFSFSKTVRIYDKDIPTLPLQTNTEGANVSAAFGNDIDISEDYIVVADQSRDSNTGQVIVYEKTADNVWEDGGAGTVLTSDDGAAEDYFGSSVATNNESILIGARGSSLGKGAVYIFQKNINTGVWTQTQKIFSSDGEANDRFGESISVSGDHFVVGASLKEVGEDVNAGAAYIFKYSSEWFEIDKLVGVDETSYETNHFGESVYINGDHIIVGSPGARSNTGVADVFYKKRSWGHLKKIEGSDVESGDEFGTSASVSGRFIITGSPKDDDAGSDSGAVFVYEDPSVTLRLAQEFEVNQQFVPSKASVYLKRAGDNVSDFWAIHSTFSTVMDATNFSTIDKGDNVITFDDTVSGFTGNGYMIANVAEGNPSLMDDELSVINYPVRAINPDTYDLWIRCINLTSNFFEAEILIDGNISKTISLPIEDPSGGLEWSWVNTKIVFPDSRDHILGIKIKEANIAIDKIYIDANSIVPFTEGPDYTSAPYLTTHMRVYDKNNINIESNSVAQYKMNDVTGTSVVNEFGTDGDYDGGGSVTSVSGKINEALYFDGSHEINTTQKFTSTFRNSFSINFWIKPDDGQPSAPGQSFCGAMFLIANTIDITINAGNIISSYIGSTSKTISNVSGLLNGQETWHMITLTVEQVDVSNARNSLYVDSVKIADSGIYTQNMSSYTSSATTLKIGADGQGLRNFEGSMDNFCIFDKVLTQEDMDFLYNEGNGTEELQGEDNEPVDPLFIYDYKNSITEVVQDDWYNFNIKVLDKFHGHTEVSDFSGNYYLVMSTSGTSTSNFITWELVNNSDVGSPSAEEISYPPSAIKF